MFIDGPKKAQNSQSMSFQLKPVATSKHIILGRCNAEMGATFAAFSSDMIALFDSVTPDGKVYLSYSFSGTNLDEFEFLSLSLPFLSLSKFFRCNEVGITGADGLGFLTVSRRV